MAASVSQYAVEFTGEISTQANAEEVTARLAEVLRLPPERAGAFLQGGPRVVRRGLDREAADKYLAVLNRTGAVFRLLADLPPEPAAPVAAPEPAAPVMAAPAAVPPAAAPAAPAAPVIAPAAVAPALAATRPAAPTVGVAVPEAPARRKKKRKKSKPGHRKSGPGLMPYLRELGLPALLIVAVLALMLGGRQFLKDPAPPAVAAKPVVPAAAPVQTAGEIPAGVAELAAMPSGGWKLSVSPTAQAAPPLLADEPRPSAHACAVAAAYLRSFETYGCRVVDLIEPKALPARWEEPGSGNYLVWPVLAAELRAAPANPAQGAALDVLVLAHSPWDRRAQEALDCPICLSFFSLYAWDRSGEEPRLVEQAPAFAVSQVAGQLPRVVERKLSAAHLVLELSGGFARQGVTGQSTSLHEVSAAGVRTVLTDFVTACSNQGSCEGDACWAFQGSITELPAAAPDQWPALRLKQTGRNAKGPVNVEETVTPAGGVYRPRLTRQCEAKG